ncbi:expressed unknown protein [Seminavis robusta]|uniref:Uncharacterized protein n=1 Tax=Seminavis robusta TaxID=568900 RepID=A0A9N8HXT5_9STRA|nr:expressed unknown protein [Seminavis robusta]|eukprot:Sro1865_g302450.1 n/a (448) ;mRNA; f:11513-12856
MALTLADDSPTRRLEKNDPALQHLYLSSDTTSDEGELEALIEALAGAQHLCHVYFRNFKVFHGNCPMKRLLAAMTTVPQLESLAFHCTEVPLDCLTLLLQEAPVLTALGLRYCKLRYQRQQVEFQAFEQALRQNTSLTDVCIECCDWQAEEHNSNNSNNNHHQTSSFLEAISYIPSLRHVECVLPKNKSTNQQNAHQLARRGRNRLPPSTLERMGQMPQLSSLRLRNIWFPQEDVALLCQSFQSPSPNRLQKLILSCDLGRTSATALATVLLHANLTQLSLRIDALDDPDAPVILAHALAQTSTSLQHFHLSGAAASQLSTKSKTALCDMMATNTALEFVRLEVADYHLQAQIAFYLQLNHWGRRELFQGLRQCSNGSSDSEELWFRALYQNATHLRAIHHFVALNPGLFARAALQVEEQRQQQQQCCKLQHFDSFDQGIEYDSDGW